MAVSEQHPYRVSLAPRFACGRGHPYAAPPDGCATFVYCIIGECERWSMVFEGADAEMRRVRRVFDDVVFVHNFDVLSEPPLSADPTGCP